MGCKCCVPAAMKVLPGDILPNLPENIIHINESTSKEQREEFEQVIRNTANRSQQLGPGFQRLGALLDATNQNQLAANLELFRFTEFGKKRNEVEQQQHHVF